MKTSTKKATRTISSLLAILLFTNIYHAKAEQQYYDDNGLVAEIALGALAAYAITEATTHHQKVHYNHRYDYRPYRYKQHITHQKHRHHYRKKHKNHVHPSYYKKKHTFINSHYHHKGYEGHKGHKYYGDQHSQKYRSKQYEYKDKRAHNSKEYKHHEERTRNKYQKDKHPHHNRDGQRNMVYRH